MALGIFKRKHKEEKTTSGKDLTEKKEKLKKTEKLEAEPTKKTKKEPVPVEKAASKSVSDKTSKASSVSGVATDRSASTKPTTGKSEGFAWRVIKEPHITEKATILAEQNQYVFKVFPRANKTEIKKAIEEMYGVKVEDVKIINVHRKRRQRGRVEGWRKGYKKAIVKIKAGQTIEILPK